VHSSETSVNIYQNIKSYIPGDTTLYSHCCKNLNSKIIFNSKQHRNSNTSSVFMGLSTSCPAVIHTAPIFRSDDISTTINSWASAEGYVKSTRTYIQLISHDTTVRFIQPDRCQENAQCIWSSPLTEIQDCEVSMGGDRGLVTVRHSPSLP
jgi:hypothetical protein